MGAEDEGLSEVQGVLRASMRRGQEAIEALKGENAALKAEVRRLRGDIEGRIAELRRDLAGELSELRGIERNVSGIAAAYTQQLDMMRRELAALEGRIAALEQFRHEQENKGLF